MPKQTRAEKRRQDRDGKQRFLSERFSGPVSFASRFAAGRDYHADDRQDAREGRAMLYQQRRAMERADRARRAQEAER